MELKFLNRRRFKADDAGVLFGQPTLEEKVKGVVKTVKEHKKDIVLGAALIIGNTVGGVIFQKGMEKIQNLENRVEALEVMDLNLLKANCMTEAHIYQDEGGDITYDQADEFCDEKALQQVREFLATQVKK